VTPEFYTGCLHAAYPYPSFSSQSFVTLQYETYNYLQSIAASYAMLCRYIIVRKLTLSQAFRYTPSVFTPLMYVLSTLVSLLILHLRLNAADRNPSQLVVGQASISLWNLRLTEGGCVPSDTADNDHPLRAKGQPGGDGRWAAGSSESSSCSVVISGYQ